jgi:competence protein ComEA
MLTAERRAMLLLLGLAVAGQGVRYVLTKPGDAPGSVQLLAGLGSESPRAQRDSSAQKARPLRDDERIDVDVAPASELARLPKVGPRLAKVIVADRQAHGSFGSLEGLDRVAGIGPGLLKTLGPHLAFGSPGEPATVPGLVGAQGPAGPCLPSSARCTTSLLNINTAGVSELDALPGIGPSKARAIVRYREEHGRFTDPQELAGVPGLSKALVTRIQGRLVAR